MSTNEQQHTQDRLNADVAHDDYMRSQGNGSHDPAFTACIMERDRLRAQNAELVALIRDALDDHDIDILGSDWTDRAQSIIARVQA